jgi:hypothetical protein
MGKCREPFMDYCGKAGLTENCLSFGFAGTPLHMLRLYVLCWMDIPPITSQQSSVRQQKKEVSFPHIPATRQRLFWATEEALAAAVLEVYQQQPWQGCHAVSVLQTFPLCVGEGYDNEQHGVWVPYDWYLPPQSLSSSSQWRWRKREAIIAI